MPVRGCADVIRLLVAEGMARGGADAVPCRSEELTLATLLDCYTSQRASASDALAALDKRFRRGDSIPHAGGGKPMVEGESDGEETTGAPSG